MAASFDPLTDLTLCSISSNLYARSSQKVINLYFTHTLVQAGKMCVKGSWKVSAMYLLLQYNCSRLVQISQMVTAKSAPFVYLLSKPWNLVCNL